MSSINLQERHIDRLIAEELEVSSAFRTWFVRRVFADSLPKEPPAACSTTISHHRIGGETDILVKLDWPSGEHAEIHIEDKLQALPQPDQALRYRAAIEECSSMLGACVLIAPQLWMRRHPAETAGYNVAIALEDIATQLGARAKELESLVFGEGENNQESVKELALRLRWREALLNGSSNRRTVYRAIEAGELTDWNMAAAEIIEAANGLRLPVSPRQRSEGRNHRSRFFRFNEALSLHGSNAAPILQLKTDPGRVSLEVRAPYDDSLHTKANDEGFTTSLTTGGTLLVDATTQSLSELTISKPVAIQIPRLEDAARMAEKLIEWWENQHATGGRFPLRSLVA